MLTHSLYSSWCWLTLSAHHDVDSLSLLIMMLTHSLCSRAGHWGSYRARAYSRKSAAELPHRCTRCASNQAESPRLVPLSGHGGACRLESHYSFESEMYGARTAIYQTSTSILRAPLFIQWGRLIELFHRPCLCYQLQSIEQNMCMLL